MKKVLFIIAPENFRDEELLVPKSFLEAKGVECQVASITTQTATGSMGAEVTPDLAVKDANPADYNAVIVIGGPGSPALANYPEVIDLLKSVDQASQVLAAICIAPTVVAKAGLVKNKKVTCFETEETPNIISEAGGTYTGKKVTRDGNLITANGPAAAKKFAKTIYNAIK